jgi:DnaJ-class molecular chaperone
VKRSKSVDVDIPPGVDTGITMRMRGQGAEGDQGYPAGAWSHCSVRLLSHCVDAMLVVV